MKKIKETVIKTSEGFEIMKISVIKKLEEIELKLRKLEVIERMTESLGEFDMKMLNKVIKSSEKINGKKYQKQKKEKEELIREEK